MEISDRQYDEYQKLKKWAKRERVYQSAKKIENLVDDIDAPIRASVAMLSLLGCEPLYSCCGFDYTGQPFHKSHQYGRPYVILTTNRRTIEFAGLFLPTQKMWVANRGETERQVNLEVIVRGNPFWRRRECIHFSEECVISTGILERFLWSCRQSFADSVTLCDTNVFAKDRNRHWQYPPKKAWTVNKSDIGGMLSF